MKLTVVNPVLCVTGFCLLIVLAGCFSYRTATGLTEIVTVEGSVTARGNEPFSAYVLKTEDLTWYVLDLDEVSREGFMSPSYLRASGTVYVSQWMGRPMTHLKVSAWEKLER